MLKQKRYKGSEKVYTTTGGLGDFFRTLPLVQKMGGIKLQPTYYHDGKDIHELIEVLLPKVDFQNHYAKLSECTNLLWSASDGVTRENAHRTLTLHPKAIKKIKPHIEKEKYIIIHAVSEGLERRYPFFNKVDLNGINYKLVGYPWQNGGIPGEVITTDFMELAQIIRGSNGVLCVDSCVMHLANLLNVPSVAIYHNEFNYHTIPNIGIGLVQPHPKLVSYHAKKLFLED